MDISVTHEQGRVPVTILHVKGPVTGEEEIQAEASRAYEAGARNIVLDLSGVPYMASPGLRAIHYVYSMLRSGTAEESDDAVHKGVRSGTWKSPHLKLAGVSRDVLEILRATGYDMFLEIHKDVKAAIKSF
jgi:anti-anti-sigma factor